MASILSIRPSRAIPSPLEGPGNLLVQQAASAPYNQQQVSHREWWLWFSALFVTALSSIAFLLTAFTRFFSHFDHFYEIRSDQARWATLCLLLIFNSWLVYRQWTFRRLRRLASPQATEGPAISSTVSETGGSAGLDPVTGLANRTSLELALGREIARARRQNTTLSLATVHIDEYADLTRRHGKSAVDAALKELARSLKKASRGSDIAARLSEDDFLLLLPECGVTEVKQVINRLSPIEVSSSGNRDALAYTTGWVDYQPGDLPADVIKRAANLLHLYDSAAKDSFSPSLR